MPIQLLQLAEREQIVVEYWSFDEPLEAVYWNECGQASIGLSKNLLRNRAHYRTVLAEELGHYFTSARHNLPVRYYTYQDQINICREEYRAVKWAAEYLLPEDKLLSCGENVYELAEHFDVDAGLVRFRFNLLSRQGKFEIRCREGLI